MKTGNFDPRATKNPFAEMRTAGVIIADRTWSADDNWSIMDFSPRSAGRTLHAERNIRSRNLAGMPRRCLPQRPARHMLACQVVATRLPSGCESRLLQRFMQVGRVRHPTENAALHLHRLDRGFVVPQHLSRRRVLQKQAPVSEIIGLPHDGMNANIGGYAAQHQVGDTEVAAGP